MKIIGKAHGQVTLDSDLETVFHYFTDHKKILGFNPLCKGVIETEFPDVYRWDFEINDPRSHPIHLIFYVEQKTHLCIDHSQKPTDDIIENTNFPRQILWSEIPIELDNDNPDHKTFTGLASGEMSIKKMSDLSTFVDVRMKVTVDFDIPILLKVFPEPIIKVMAEIAMTAGMQNVSNKMLENISKDFRFSSVNSNQSSSVDLN